MGPRKSGAVLSGATYNVKKSVAPGLPGEALFAIYPPPQRMRASCLCGEVAERLKAPHSKCGIRVTVSGVRIPPSPP